MNWENMTSPEFEAAVPQCGGVCLLPIGVVEKHGDHLPLGQDTIYIHEAATRAAGRETAMVFPFYYFGQILEARHVPGTIAIRYELQLSLLENVCDEIHRNGFPKIIIVNGHGGNCSLLNYFCQIQLERQKSYMVYLSDIVLPDNKAAPWKEAAVDGHAGELETVSMMYLRPELVKADRFASYGMPLDRLKALKEVRITTGFNWYADFPGHFAGEKVSLTREKGEAFVNAHLDLLVKQIKAVKKDDVTPRLQKEFFERAEKPANRYP
ncbi:MAG: creatininase family protein [Spirochaetales bacterium]|nr:creatininase family protein [Spirochaetales bacterium]